MSADEAVTYLAPTAPFRDWLRLQTFAFPVGPPGASTARIFASTLPGGCDMPAFAFHRAPGGTFDVTLDIGGWQFDCYGTKPEDAESVAAALATVLASTPPRTRIAAGLVFEGPAVIVDTFYLPVQTSRAPRQVLRARLVFAAY